MSNTESRKQFEEWIANLRLATKSENQHNGDRRANNTSGVKGVSWAKRANKWRAYLALNGRRLELGDFDSFDDAVAARRKAELENGIFTA